MIDPVKNHPAGWRGEGLFRKPDWQMKLEPEDIRELEAALRVVDSRNLDLEAIHSDNFPLPRLGERMKAASTNLEEGSGVLLLRGFPIERFDITACRRIFWGLSRHLGTPVSQSAIGERIFHVEDAGFGDKDSRARGPNSNKALRFHTDRCDVIAFMCIRKALSGGRNLLASSVDLHNEILIRRPDLLEALYQPYCYERHNVDQGNEDLYLTQPVFARYEGHFIANMLRVLIDRAHKNPRLPDMTAKQMEALDFVDALAAEPDMHAGFHQEPGDFLFVNNFVVFHTREGFEDHTNPDHKRLLLRLWLSVPNSRPLPPEFSGMYGNVAAGAVRGGMRPFKTLG